MKNKNLLLFGGQGMVGSRIKSLLSPRYNITAPTRTQVDLISDKAIKSFLEKNKYQAIVYAAGITNQDEAEEKKDLTTRINGEAPLLISQIAAKSEIPVIYLSTDAVFRSTEKNTPHLESSKVDPLNYYGKTKALGEEMVMSCSSLNSVIRLISVYTPHYDKKADFVRKMINTFESKVEYGGIIDQYFNPTYVDCGVLGVDRVIEKNLGGIFHVGSVDCISNFEFAQLVAKTFGYRKSLVVQTKFSDFQKNKKVPRGQFCCLDIAYSKKMLGDEVFRTNKENIEKFNSKY